MNASASFLTAGVSACLATVEFTYWLLWGGSLALSVTLVILLWTRWGQSRPLHKCAALSLIVHLILAFLTMTVRIVTSDRGGDGGGGGAPIHVRIVEEIAAPPTTAVASNPSKTPTPVLETTTAIVPPPLLEAPSKSEEPKPEPKVEQPELKAEPVPIVAEVSPNEPAKQIIEPQGAKDATPPTEPTAVIAKATQTPNQSPAFTDAHSTKNSDAPPTDVTSKPDSSPPPTPTVANTAATPITGNAYSLRSAPGRLGLVAGQGGNAKTEAAVAAALKWLANAQSDDGRWDAMRFGGGQEEMTLGQNRGGAGRGADTGVSALALLAYLGAGHSHVQGAYQENVRRGLDFLLRSQAIDGSLYGDATLYAQMYCHSMATFALAEAMAVSGDRRLEAAATKAVNYSLAAQNATTGGWRYRPGDTGDTSQLGWQIMALASAQRAGIRIPDRSWSGVGRFLRTVERGTNGGLASYRPDSPASTSMTAEALYCRLVLEEMNGTRLLDSAATEATAQLLAALPSAERTNLYYWYYATLALHHRQQANDAAKAAWRTWNEAMAAALTKAQLTDGDNAGSWESNTIWGGYGGRVYTTALAAMCLEVYYRYAPAPPRGDRWSAARPGMLSAPR
jgi:outer membrane biosynthesis protein TonB